MSRYLISFFVFIVIFSACNSGPEYPRVSMMPDGTDAMMFRAYATNSEKELVGEIVKFTRQVVREDTIDGHPCRVYVSNNQQFPFYTDEDGTVFQKNTENLSAFVVAYGLTFVDPFEISYWQTMLKTNDGLDSKWEVSVDTVFSVLTMDGKNQDMRYFYNGKAKFNGWTKTFVAGARRQVEVLDAHWYSLKRTLINTTTGDTLFNRVGEAHQYFTEAAGSAKYTYDFSNEEMGKEPRKMYGTWEHIDRFNVK